MAVNVELSGGNEDSLSHASHQSPLFKSYADIVFQSDKELGAFQKKRFLTPKYISEKGYIKLKKRIVPEINKEDILLFFDSSLIAGTYKRGLVFTSDRLYYDLKTAPDGIEYHRIKNVGWDKRKIKINDTAIEIVNEHEEILFLASLIKRLSIQKEKAELMEKANDLVLKKDLLGALAIYDKLNIEKEKRELTETILNQRMKKTHANDRSIQTCSKCGGESSNEQMSYKYWVAGKIVQTEKKGYRTAGWPLGGEIIVEGIKLNRVRRFATGLCELCQKEKHELHKNASRFIKSAVVTVLLLAAVLAGGYFLDGNFSFTNPIYLVLTVCLALGVLFLLIVMGNQPGTSELIEETHRLCADKMLKTLESDAGLILSEESDYIEYETNLINYGWSKIECWRDMDQPGGGINRIEVSEEDREDILANQLKVDHFGQYLNSVG